MKKQMGKIRLAVQIGAGALLVAGGLSNLSLTLLIILVSTVLAGPIFCGWVCPFGTLQDIVSKLTKGIKKHKMPKGIQKGIALSRYILMAVTTLLTVDFVFTIMQYDARINFLSVLEGKVLTVGAYIVLGMYLLTTVFFERPFCNYMCPQGAKYGLFSALRPFRVVRDSETCVNCGKCDKACPMNIDIMGHNNVKSLQCINCMSCVSACPKQGALKYGIIKLNRKSAAAYFLAVAVILATSTVAMALQLTAAQSELDAAEAQAAATLQAQTAESQTVTETPVQTQTDGTTTESINSSDNAGENENESDDSSGETTSSNTNQTTQGSQTSSTIPKTTTAAKTATAHTKTSAVGSSTTASTSSTTSTSTSTNTTTAPATTSQNTVSTATGAAAGIADGTYTGEANGFRGPMTVAVTVKNEQIVSVEVVDHSDDRKWFNRAVNMVPSWIIEAQSTDVDSVSGATYSSLGIINAAKNALSNAK